ncbi:hypothetical protein M5K25_013140 [Dendrobium thyrsiflorum]|uniref:DEAD-box RNA helicase Q domain-containing protein n=1 Tax=Dendrobium thyrsiflorum TaxID=117978 RepID=A0ABD0V5Z3_DENTH
MGEVRENDVYEDELLDYDDEAENATVSLGVKINGESAKKGYVGIHSSGFRDFLLKPELLRAIVDSGFEHPSEVKRIAFKKNKNCVLFSLKRGDVIVNLYYDIVSNPYFSDNFGCRLDSLIQVNTTVTFVVWRRKW